MQGKSSTQNNNGARDVDPGKTFKTTGILYTALTTGMVLILLAGLFISQYMGPLQDSLNTSPGWLKWVGAFVSVGGLLWGRKKFHASLRSIAESENSLHQKLDRHRRALVRYLLITDIVILFNTVLFLMTANFVFLVYGAVMLGGILAEAPLKRRLVIQLALNDAEQDQIT